MSFQLQNPNRTPAEAAVRRSSSKSVFLKVFTGKHLCGISFLIRFQALGLQHYLKRFQHRCFPVDISKFLRTAVSKEHLWWLSVYKSNMTIMSFQRKRNVDILCPRRFNVEITFNKQCFPDFKFLNQLIIGCYRRQHNTKRNQSQCYVIYVKSILFYLFCPKDRTIDSRKTSITQEWLVLERCPTPH